MGSVVETRSGRLAGRSLGELEVFLGIPYAAPPTGPNRLRPPQPPKPWSGTRLADAFLPDAPQPASELGFEGVATPAPQAEDCLGLNVWTPGCDDARRPVMVWIHGGGFQTGGASRPIYDGAALARRGDVVVVSLNYRLGLLGLAAHPELGPEGPTANWALRDQIAALEWVRDEIAGFGGDASNVTIFGESAGGAAVWLLSVSPRARGLFRRAIAQSSSPLPVAFDQAVEATEALCAALGCRPRDLREVRLARLLSAQPKWVEIASRGRTAARPVIDGDVLPDWPAEAVAAGATRGIEIFSGSCRDEANLFLAQDPQRHTLDADALLGRVRRRFTDRSADRARAVVDVYRNARAARGESTDPWELFSAIMTDRMIRVPALQLLERHCAAGERGGAYLVSWESPVRSLGACHALELPFVFGTLAAPGMDRFAGSGPEAETLSLRMRDAWLAIARGESAESWPAYDVVSRRTRVFDRTCTIESAPYEPERAVWDDLLR